MVTVIEALREDGAICWSEIKPPDENRSYATQLNLAMDRLNEFLMWLDDEDPDKVAAGKRRGWPINYYDAPEIDRLVKAHSANNQFSIDWFRKRVRIVLPTEAELEAVQVLDSAASNV